MNVNDNLHPDPMMVMRTENRRCEEDEKENPPHLAIVAHPDKRGVTK